MKVGIPSFIDTLEIILADMEVESITLASEISEMNPTIHTQIQGMIDGKNAQYVTHESFKELSQRSKAIIRAGEASLMQIAFYMRG